MALERSRSCLRCGETRPAAQIKHCFLPEKIVEPFQLSASLGNVSSARFAWRPCGLQKSCGRCLRLGLLFSGGPAPGGHNVAVGMLQCLRSLSDKPSSDRDDGAGCLIGFLGGPAGLVEKRWTPIDKSTVARYRNQGGFELLSSGRLKLETPAHLEAAAKSCRELQLNGLVVVGGDDSNTNAAHLAEYFTANGVGTVVVGVPKTIDDDMQGGGIAVSFGFDSASKVFAEMIGNVCADARSCRKYWHFIRVMGRQASHLTLECALQCCPNIALLGEEIAAKGTSLADIVEDIATLVASRAAAGLHHGVVLVPEGLLTFLPEVAELMDEINDASTDEVHVRGAGAIRRRLSAAAAAAAAGLPDTIFEDLLVGRDSHGNVALSMLHTESLLAKLVGARLQAMATRSESSRVRFRPVTHFCGYEGRAGLPTNFDATYANALGHAAALLVAGGATATIAAVTNPTAPPKRWEVAGVPMCRLMCAERRAGRDVPVIRKQLVSIMLYKLCCLFQYSLMNV